MYTHIDNIRSTLDQEVQRNVHQLSNYTKFKFHARFNTPIVYLQ